MSLCLGKGIWDKTEKKCSMGFRKTSHGNQDKNIVILERNYLLERFILVSKAAENKTFQPAPLQTMYFQLDKNLFSLLSFNRK